MPSVPPVTISDSNNQMTVDDGAFPEWVKTETISHDDYRGMREMYRRWLLHKRLDHLEAKVDRVLALLENHHEQ